MNKAWPQQERFRDLVNSQREADGLSREQVADLLGISDSGLKSLMYDRTRKPSLDLLTAAAKLFQVSLAELWDDPAAAAPESSSEFDRFMLRTMGTDLGKMTEAQKQAAFNAWKAFSDGILGR